MERLEEGVGEKGGGREEVAAQYPHVHSHTLAPPPPPPHAPDHPLAPARRVGRSPSSWS